MSHYSRIIFRFEPEVGPNGVTLCIAFVDFEDLTDNVYIVIKQCVV